MLFVIDLCNSAIMKNIVIILGISLLTNTQIMAKQKEVVTLGSGCFWCTEAIFESVKGVESAVSGYSGGDVANPSYKEVCTGRTGHAEVVQVTFDPEIISFAEILKIFFKMHDPTTLNRQGNDVGTQYRSVVFYHTEAQREIAEKIKQQLNDEKIWNEPIVTEITAYKNFYTAEDYHQEYYQNNKSQPYCNYVITPKYDKFLKVFKDYVK